MKLIKMNGKANFWKSFFSVALSAAFIPGNVHFPFRCVNFVSGVVIHFHPAVTYCVLPLVGRNYPSYVTCCPPPRQICALHYDIRHVQVNKPIC